MYTIIFFALSTEKQQGRATASFLMSDCSPWQLFIRWALPLYIVEDTNSSPHLPPFDTLRDPQKRAAQYLFCCGQLIRSSRLCHILMGAARKAIITVLVQADRSTHNIVALRAAVGVGIDTVNGANKRISQGTVFRCPGSQVPTVLANRPMNSGLCFVPILNDC